LDIIPLICGFHFGCKINTTSEILSFYIICVFSLTLRLVIISEIRGFFKVVYYGQNR
jgi:hypothetical protein